MATIIAWIFTIIMVLVFVYSSYRYVKESHKMSQSKSLIERRKRANEKEKKSMNTEQLRKVLKEANDKGQTGLFIWANWTIWDDIAFDMEPGNKNYDFAISRIYQDEEATITYYNNGFELVAFIAIPVRKLSSDEAFFNRVLEICNKCNYQGPFTLLPSNETVKTE